MHFRRVRHLRHDLRFVEREAPAILHVQPQRPSERPQEREHNAADGVAVALPADREARGVVAAVARAVPRTCGVDLRNAGGIPLERREVQCPSDGPDRLQLKGLDGCSLGIEVQLCGDGPEGKRNLTHLGLGQWGLVIASDAVLQPQFMRGPWGLGQGMRLVEALQLCAAHGHHAAATPRTRDLHPHRPRTVGRCLRCARRGRCEAGLEGGVPLRRIGRRGPGQRHKVGGIDRWDDAGKLDEHLASGEVARGLLQRVPAPRGSGPQPQLHQGTRVCQALETQLRQRPEKRRGGRLLVAPAAEGLVQRRQPPVPVRRGKRRDGLSLRVGRPEDLVPRGRALRVPEDHDVGPLRHAAVLRRHPVLVRAVVHFVREGPVVATRQELHHAALDLPGVAAPPERPPLGLIKDELCVALGAQGGLQGRRQRLPLGPVVELVLLAPQHLNGAPHGLEVPRLLLLKRRVERHHSVHKPAVLL
mmetsp:Transcript_82609/g.137808  ORF Transcript_82609/g.137808 Transcript_82609/m.137808 type:complete len:474 (-) Transcript_82609:870-2291(-)